MNCRGALVGLKSEFGAESFEVVSPYLTKKDFAPVVDLKHVPELETVKP